MFKSNVLIYVTKSGLEVLHCSCFFLQMIWYFSVETLIVCKLFYKLFKHFVIEMVCKYLLKKRIGCHFLRLVKHKVLSCMFTTSKLHVLLSLDTWV